MTENLYRFIVCVSIHLMRSKENTYYLTTYIIGLYIYAKHFFTCWEKNWSRTYREHHLGQNEDQKRALMAYFQW